MKTPFRKLLIVLSAAGAGAGAALLFAPYSGQKTRRIIRLRAESLAKDLQEEARANVAIFHKAGTDRAKRAFSRLSKRIRSVAA
jgi:gas vesicle protein